MRARRDPFSRETLQPVIETRLNGCSWCGQIAYPRHPLYAIRIERDGGRSDVIGGTFCGWSCAESYHDSKLAR